MNRYIASAVTLVSLATGSTLAYSAFRAPVAVDVPAIASERASEAPAAASAGPAFFQAAEVTIVATVPSKRAHKAPAASVGGECTDATQGAVCAWRDSGSSVGQSIEVCSCGGRS